MTSPNFRPEDVKVGSVIWFTDNLHRTVTEIQSNPDVAYFDVADRFGLWLDSDFPKTVVNGQMGDVCAVSINVATDTRLTAIEERLSKLEGSAVKVEFGQPYATEGVDFKEGGLGKRVLGLDTDYYTKNAFAEHAATDAGTFKGHLANMDKQSPKVCPVTGMFVEEPVEGQTYFISWAHNEPYAKEWLNTHNHHCFFEQGNCFATREDAERYAKHLKAMAKLRRLGGVGTTTVTQNCNLNYGDISMDIIPSIHYLLTTEEQNALMWPNEEK